MVPISCGSRRLFDALITFGVVMINVAGHEALASRWSSIGPESEPVIHSLVVDTRAQEIVYAGGIGTIWRTDDGGKTWLGAATPVTNECEVRALALHPTDSSTLYAGCIGAIKSTDGGRSWNAITNGMEVGDSMEAVWAIAIHPVQPAILYAATPFGKVFKSRDAGESWALTGALPEDVRPIRALVIDPATPETIYVAATRGGVVKSTDGGMIWSSMNEGLPTTAVTSLAIGSPDSRTIYAGTIAAGIFKTTDGASTWREVLGPRDVNGVAFTVAELAVDPFSSSTVYAAMGDHNLGVFQTRCRRNVAADLRRASVLCSSARSRDFLEKSVKNLHGINGPVSGSDRRRSIRDGAARTVLERRRRTWRGRRVLRSDSELVPSRHRRRTRLRALVHGEQRKQDRTDQPHR